MTPVLEKREYYGTSPAESARGARPAAAGAPSGSRRPPPSRPEGRANSAVDAETRGKRRASAGSPGGLAATRTRARDAAAAVKAEGRYGSALSGGAMPASAFQGRSKV